MTSLGDFLGALMSEATLARVHADLQALRVAELYAGAPLLDGVPLPRFRLPEMTLDVPVAIEGDEGGTAENPPVFRPLSATAFREAIGLALDEVGIELGEEPTANLSKRAATSLKKRWSKPVALGNALSASKAVARETSDALNELAWEPKGTPRLAAEAGAATVEAQRRRALEEFRRSLVHRMHVAVLGPAGSGPRLRVLAKTAQVKEVTDHGLLTRLHVTLREDAFEVVEVQRSDGSNVRRLVPE